MKFVALLVKMIICLLVLSLGIEANAGPVGIASGQPSGTNYPMAADIARVCSTPTSPITNVYRMGRLTISPKCTATKRAILYCAN